jgi:hypothetical protein
VVEVLEVLGVLEVRGVLVLVMLEVRKMRETLAFGRTP